LVIYIDFQLQQRHLFGFTPKRVAKTASYIADSLKFWCRSI